ncbi:serine acetyltransferase [Clostridium sp. chh4-2]|nr:serine acetyltransferase [Clostridium sp. chh4-2]
MLSLKFYMFNYREYLEVIRKDQIFNATFRNGSTVLKKKERKAIEYKTVKLYRKYQVNIGNIWGYFYRWRLERKAVKTGIEFLGNANIGEGLIIGHWGRIIINGNAKFGNEIMITHNVTIGRDIRGKRKGAPTFGNRVCIRANSTIVGNITIGDDVLIAPNTFVNFDVPSHSVVIGNPATIHAKTNATEGHLGVLDYEK